MMSKKPKMPKAGDGMKDAMAMPRFGARAMRPGGMAKGGKIHADEAMDRKLIRKEIARAEKMEEKSEKGMKKGGGVKKMALGGMLGKMPTQPQTQSQLRGGPTQSSMQAQARGGAGALGGFRGPNLTLPPASAAGKPSAPSAEMERGASQMRMDTLAAAMRGDMKRDAQQTGPRPMPAPALGGKAGLGSAPGARPSQPAVSMGGLGPRGPVSSVNTTTQRDMMGRRPMKKGGYVKMARGGGIETKGKTKGKFI